MHEAEPVTPHRPSIVPRPLLLAVAEAHQEASVETLLTLGSNPNVLFSRTGAKEDVEPLFFHLVTSHGRPPDAIIHKVLRFSDMSARDQSGRTILFRAMDHNFSGQFVRALFKYGVDISARDKHGRTARDHAEYIKKSKYLTDIDDHILDIVKECNLERLQAIVLQGYDHIIDITDNKGINIKQAFRDFHTLNPRKEDMLSYMDRIRTIQVDNLNNGLFNYTFSLPQIDM